MSRLLRLENLAIGAVAGTMASMVAGSLVHGTGSSLACPDWPLCHGTAFPKMTGGVEFEHTHRLAAALVVTLTGLLAAGVWRRPGRVERRMAIVALGLVVLQAILGAATVVMRLPTAVSVAHLATSMTFLGVLVALAAHLAHVPPKTRDATSRAWLGVAIVAAFGQIVLGAVVRHTGAALACLDLPFCAGSVWPASSLQRVHVAHRAGAVVASSVVMAATMVAWLRSGNQALARTMTIAPAVIVIVQTILGIAVVSLGAPLPLVTAHHATAALLLASLVLARCAA
jgi:heme A synthase